MVAISTGEEPPTEEQQVGQRAVGWLVGLVGHARDPHPHPNPNPNPDNNPRRS